MAASAAEGPTGTNSSSSEWIRSMGWVSSSERRTQSVRATSMGSCTPTRRRAERRPIRARLIAPTGAGTRLAAAWWRSTSDQSMTGASRTTRDTRAGQPGPVEGLQHDRPAHRPPRQDDLAGAGLDGVEHRRLDVAPLGQPEVVPAVRAGRRTDVVAVHGNQRRVTQLVGHRHRPEALLTAGAAAVHEDGPAVAAHRRTARAGTSHAGTSPSSERTRTSWVGSPKASCGLPA